MGKSKTDPAAAGAKKKRKGSPRSTISSSSPLGMPALQLLEQWRKSGRVGNVLLSEDEYRAERLGGVLHSLAPSLDVLVFPKLNTLPFDGLVHTLCGREATMTDNACLTLAAVQAAAALFAGAPVVTSFDSRICCARVLKERSESRD